MKSERSRAVRSAAACATAGLLCLIVSSIAGGSEPWISISGLSTLSRPPDPDCGTLLWHADGSAEGAIAWRYAGVVPPYYGAFAERYEGEWEVCAQVFGFGTLPGLPEDRRMDVYIWDDAQGNVPGQVLCLTPGVDPGTVAFWPNISYHRAELAPGCCTGAVWWAGFWGDWPGQELGWFVGEDLDGPGGGWPVTNIAPGLGYPSGWQPTGVVWGGAQALFIGAEVIPCDPTPVEAATWGRVKSLYR